MFLFSCRGGVKLLKKPSMSLILNYESGVFYTTTTDASLPVTPKDAQITDINMNSSDCPDCGHIHAFDCKTNRGHLHGLRQHHGISISTWPLMADQVTDIHISSGRSIDHKQHSLRRQHNCYQHGLFGFSSHGISAFHSGQVISSQLMYAR